MTRLPALSLLFVASAASAQNAERLPSREDVGAAHQAYIVRECEALIDECEILPLPATPDRIERLDCTGRATVSTCRFDYAGMRCRARFLLERSGGERRWVVEWRPRRLYGRPQVRCRN